MSAADAFRSHPAADIDVSMFVRLIQLIIVFLFFLFCIVLITRQVISAFIRAQTNFKHVCELPFSINVTRRRCAANF